ncbi:MAG: hypothetical protein SFV54_19380 [Bryobacteraceae bacterium]|nr:hypothetical protein [Bryobacteraceae bacterium]
MKRILIFGYGVAAYLLFFATFLWAMAFVGNVAAPKTIDSGAPGDKLTAILVNASLLGLFAIQHTVMARRGFKTWIKSVLPAAIERSTFVFVASAILFGTFWFWEPMPDAVWAIESPVAAAAVSGLYWLGWAVVLLASFLINHFDLFGLRQVTLALKNQSYKPLPFRMTFLYRFVRHPLLLGFVIAFWSAPVMSEGRLLFAILSTAYILVGIQFEERDLAREHGETYRRYQRQVPMLLPYKAGVKPGSEATVEGARAQAVLAK